MPRGPRLDAPGVLHHVMGRGIGPTLGPGSRPWPQPLAAARRSLLTGYAGAFTRRPQRHGHRIQNRDTSIVVEQD